MNETFRQQVTLAARYVDLDQPQRAAEVLGQMSPDALDRPQVWWLRVKVTEELQGPSRAVEVAHEALARFPQNPSLLIQLADLQVDLQQVVQAEDTLLRVLAVDPENVEALCDYARVMALVNQNRKARALIERAASLDPEDGQVWLARYRLAHLTADDQTTRRLAGEVAALTDGSGKAVMLLAIEAIKRGDHRTAWRFLRRAAKADPSIVELFGREGFLEMRALNHPLLVFMWPVERLGSATLWLLVVGALYGMRAGGVDTEVVGVFSIAFVVYAVYTWVAPPFTRWLTGAPQ